MVRVIYRRQKPFYGERRRELVVESFHELFALLLNEPAEHSGFVPKSDRFLKQSGPFVQESLDATGVREAYQDKIGQQRTEPSTHPCSCCGMKFSANLMTDGVCHNCRSGKKGRSQAGGSDHRGVSPSVSDKALMQAYQVLGCDERDSDEVIKRRHRELAKEFHSDRISPEESCDRISHANERFCKAQEAYEIIMVTRKKRS